MAARPLTKGEITLAKTIFKDSINYDSVHIHDKKYIFFQPKNTTMSPNGHIYACDNYCSDFSIENSSTKAHFIHEMTHVWQVQNKILNPKISAIKEQIKHKFNYAKSYKYELDQKKDLLDYGMEQQARIIEDYYFLKSELPHVFNNDHKEDFEAVLQNFLKDPSYKNRFPRKKLSSPKFPK